MNVGPASPLPPETKGWCPSLPRPMRSGDGLIARIKPTAATFRARDLRPVIEAAMRNGNGHFDLTRRGNLQARGFGEDGHAAFARIVVDRGFAASNANAEARRTVLASPFSPEDDPSCAFDAHRIARALEAGIVDTDDLAALPGKFGVAVDGGGVLSIAQDGCTANADIMVAPLDGRPALFLAGRADIAATPSDQDIVPAVLAVMRSFANTANRDIRRMRDWVAAIGVQAVFAKAGLEAAPARQDAHKADPPLGWATLNRHAGAVLVAAPFGRLVADQLSDLCTLSEAHGDGTLRLTPWRSLVLPGVVSEYAPRVIERCNALGLITQPGDARLRMVVCTGAPGCHHGHARTLEHAAQFAPHWNRQGTLHVSGCAKGCAHSGRVEVTLLAAEDGYQWIEAGGVTDPALASRLRVSEAVARLRGESA